MSHDPVTEPAQQTAHLLPHPSLGLPTTVGPTSSRCRVRSGRFALWGQDNCPEEVGAGLVAAKRTHFAADGLRYGHLVLSRIVKVGSAAVRAHTLAPYDVLLGDPGLGGKALLRGRPGGEEPDCVCRRRTGRSGVDVEVQPGFGRKFHGLEVEVELGGYRRMIEISAAGRAGTPDEVGNLAALLMGPDGGFITGSDFLMDGGVTAAYWYGDLAPEQD